MGRHGPWACLIHSLVYCHSQGRWAVDYERCFAQILSSQSTMKPALFAILLQHTFIHLFSKCFFTEHLRYTRHSSRPKGVIGKQKKIPSLRPQGLQFVMEETHTALVDTCAMTVRKKSDKHSRHLSITGRSKSTESGNDVRSVWFLIQVPNHELSQLSHEESGDRVKECVIGEITRSSPCLISKCSLLIKHI